MKTGNEDLRPATSRTRVIRQPGQPPEPDPRGLQRGILWLMGSFGLFAGAGEMPRCFNGVLSDILGLAAIVAAALAYLHVRRAPDSDFRTLLLIPMYAVLILVCLGALLGVTGAFQ